MSSHAASTHFSDWRRQLPVLTGSSVTLREPVPQDVDELLDVLTSPDATGFNLQGPISRENVQRLVEQATRNRAAGVAFTYAVTMNGSGRVVGLLQVRRLDPAFESAEWECVITPASRGTGVFVEAARLAGSFAFRTAGVHRLEARIVFENGRGSGALRKIGAVHEGILRRSIRVRGHYVDQMLWSVLDEDWDHRWLQGRPRVH